MLQAHPQLAAAAVDAGGDMPQLVAQPGGLGAGELAVQTQRLGPGDQVGRGQGELEPHGVAVEVAAGQVCHAQLAQVADAVLGSGPGAVAALQGPRCRHRAGR